MEYLEDVIENFCNAALKKRQMVSRENIKYMSNTLYHIKIKLYRERPRWSSVKNLPYNAGNEVQTLVGELRSLMPRGNYCA